MSDGPKKLICKFCGEEVRGWGNLRKHIFGQHGSELKKPPTTS